ncbi:DUF4349 domain-containing protein [Nakamurella flavida]|uniref:DUF4349 domain-containing protein n=1 Tax=Nakamurella flavida TaxID=363630 RepID=A0A939C4C5_9ACTN|nr:DUF4349 domain-containing protein [Nakamurella flavida]MBM9477961.1 DUF4349 domain-containing protein [Nakamurella flavida]MDP9778323.1 hypothetical protein [Nakamurella flavida]
MAAPHTARPSRVRPSRFRAALISGVAVFSAGLVLAAAGCTGQASSTSAVAPAMETFAAASTMAGPAEAAPAQAASSAAGSASAAAGGAAAEAPGVAPGSAPDVAPQATTARSVIRTADLRVRLDVPAPAATGSDAEDRAARDRDRAAALAAAVSSARSTVAGLGGFVAAATDDEASAQLTLRVPTAAYDQARGTLAALGTVTSSTESATDVTAELVDAQSRVDTMTASVARVRQLLAGAQAIGDVLAIESELTAREAELESWQRQVAALGGQVDLATISVAITATVADGAPEVVVAEPERNAFVTGLANGWGAVTALLTGLAAVLGALLPFLPVLLVAGWAAWWLLRGRSRRAARSARGPAAGPATE